MLSLRCLPIEKKALLLSEIAMAGLCIYRFYDYLVTGFFISDEFGYFYDAVHGTMYGGRWFFGWLNIILFRMLNITSVDSYAYFLPFYLFLWSGLTVLLVYLTLKELKFSGLTVALSLVSSFVLVSFVLLSLGFLTESVGLTLAMGGIYFVLRYFHSNSDNWRLVSPLFAAFLFGAAGGTREPYDAFLIVGILLVIFAAVKHAKEMEGSRYGKKALALLSIALFLIPAGSLYYANSEATSQLPSLGQQIVNSAITNQPTKLPNVTLTETTTFTSNFTQTSTVVKNTTSTLTTEVTNTGVVTTEATSVVTSRTTVTVTNLTQHVVTQVTTTVTQVNKAYPFYARSLLLNTLAVFIGGIALGWGPLAFLIGLAGFFILFRTLFTSRDKTRLFVLLIALVALASYFVVSYIFAPDPNYLSFQNYSTIIRFSDTATPAFFLLAPFALAHFSNQRRAISFGAILVVFLLLAVPTYQIYAASNLNYSEGSPFQLGYSTPAAQVRDYFSAHPGVELDMIGVPYGWSFVPGVEDITNVHVYAQSGNPLFPHLVSGNFTAMRWSVFYIYVTDPASMARDDPFLRPFLNSTWNQSTTGYIILSSVPVIANPQFTLLEVKLLWH